MKNDLRQGRALTIFDFGVYCNKILEHEGKYPNKMKRQLAKLKKKMTAASNDAILKDLIRADLLILAEVEKIMECRNEGDEVGEMRHNLQAHRLWGAADAIAIRLDEELS